MRDARHIRSSLPRIIVILISQEENIAALLRLLEVDYQFFADLVGGEDRQIFVVDEVGEGVAYEDLFVFFIGAADKHTSHARLCAELAFRHVFQLVLAWHLYLDFDLETDTKLVFDVLGAAKAFEYAAFDHDAHLGAECFSLLHEMRGKNNGTVLVAGDLADHFPHEASSLRVHTCRRLVQQDDGRVAQNGNCNTDFSLVASTERAGGLVSVRFKSEFLDNVVHQLLAPSERNSLDPGEVLDVLFDGQRLEDRIVLGAVADQLPTLLEVLLHVHALDLDRAGRWFLFRRQNLEGGRLSSTVDSKQAEAFALAESERKILNCA